MSVCVLGSINLDVVTRVTSLPKPGETVAGHSLERLPGGKGANQAVAAARAGAETFLIGAVGRDEAGATLLTSLKAAGVSTLHVAELAEHPTGQAFISVSVAGENHIVVAGGANLAVTPETIPAAALAHCKVLLAQLETPADAIAALFGAPEAAGAAKLLNAAPAIPEGRRLFPLADILIVNETELAAYAGLGAVTDDPHAVAEAARGLIARPGQVVVVTLGGAGAVAVGAAGHELVVGRPAAVVDTTGAGDCFCGVLAARLAEGHALPAALTWANAAASLSTERAGASPSMPSFDEISAVLAF
jgi:ribokinase